MTNKRRPYNQYSDEFKAEALRQLEASNRPATELAAQLGIRPNMLYKWRDQLAKKDQAKRGRPKKEEQSELTTLRQENKRLKEDLDILKKAAAYFAKELK